MPRPPRRGEAIGPSPITGPAAFDPAATTMRHPREEGPTPPAKAALARRVADWAGIAAGRPGAEERALHELAALIREARGVAELHQALARLACQAFGAGRAEVIDPAAPNGPARLACWPAEGRPVATDSTASRETILTCRAEAPPPPATEPDGATLRLPIRAGGADRGVLVLHADGHRRWSSRSIRRLTTLTTLAAAADQALWARGLATERTARDPVTGLPDEAFLATYLEKAMAQARRRHEPLSVLAIAPDRLAAVRESYGPRISDAALQRVARAVVATLRGGDLVARVSADRLVAVLPMAQMADALAVAEAVRRAIGEAGMAGATHVPLTATIGVAGFPSDAEEPEDLLAAAVAALGHARSQGRNRVARPPCATARSRPEAR